MGFRASEFFLSIEHIKYRENIERAPGGRCPRVRRGRGLAGLPSAGSSTMSAVARP